MGNTAWPLTLNTKNLNSIRKYCMKRQYHISALLLDACHCKQNTLNDEKGESDLFRAFTVPDSKWNDAL